MQVDVDDDGSDSVTNSQDSTENATVYIYKVTKTAAYSSPITVQFQVNGTPLTMEVDTGAAVSIISEQTRKRCFPSAVVRPSIVCG